MTTKFSDTFYRDLAPVYHEKVDWGNRLKKEERLHHQLVSRGDVKRILDLGCGDGGHAEFYTKKGIRYTGIDNSREMIAMARHAHKSRLASFRVGEMQRLSSDLSGRFDLCLLIGNTLPHLLTERALGQTLAQAARCLTVGGRFVIQTVNPGILRGRNVSFLAPKLANGRRLFLPFYVCRGTHWDFHMVIVTMSGQKLEGSQVLITKLRFWSKAEIVRAGRASGLALEATYGSAALTAYQPRRSDNLILIFKRK